ncbi:hypothetical protein TWF481_000011 [Arthrobotrys musiformis]|uniref:Uncharacterized protein n=1 Tax=Arthrobotrys musiformis TaxID=47236 RepID=A0AAV9WME8_9PEZI
MKTIISLAYDNNIIASPYNPHMLYQNQRRLSVNLSSLLDSNREICLGRLQTNILRIKIKRCMTHFSQPYIWLAILIFRIEKHHQQDILLEKDFGPDIPENSKRITEPSQPSGIAGHNSSFGYFPTLSSVFQLRVSFDSGTHNLASYFSQILISFSFRRKPRSAIVT